MDAPQQIATARRASLGSRPSVRADRRRNFHRPAAIPHHAWPWRCRPERHM